MGSLQLVVVVSLLAGLATLALAATPEEEEAPEAQAEGTEAVEIDPARLEDESFVLRHEVERIDGEKEELAEYDGKVLLIVNVASRCGYTKQYEGLEKLYREYKDRGLVVMGFPANDFMRQEPGSNKEILEFCESRFDVTFPMFAKIRVKGKDVHPLYEQLAELPKPAGGKPSWNFNKYLVDRDGKAVEHFASKIKPTDEKLVRLIEELLGPEDEDGPVDGPEAEDAEAQG